MVSITAVKSTSRVQVDNIGNHKELHLQTYFVDNVMKEWSLKINASVKLAGQSAIIEFNNIGGEFLQMQSSHNMKRPTSNCQSFIFFNRLESPIEKHIKNHLRSNCRRDI